MPAPAAATTTNETYLTIELFIKKEKPPHPGYHHCVSGKKHLKKAAKEKSKFI
jgi:hypothetical protein